MLHIYIDKDTLAKIYVKEKDKEDENQNTWYKIFKKQDCIYVNSASDIKSDYSDEIYDLESQDNSDEQLLNQLYRLQQLADFQEGYHVYLKKSNIINMDDIVSNPTEVHKDPCAIYILNIDKETAEKIQREYGVICQSTDNLDDSILTEGFIDMSPHYGDRDYGWERVLKMHKKYPSNAVIINDRNLFSNETLDSESGKPGNRLGIENLYEILNAIIPKKFCGDYQVFLCFDKSSLNSNVTEDYICKQIQSLIKRLKRRGTIVIEVLVLHGDSSPKYNLTHNRRVLTNYFILTAEHMLKAFDNTKSISTQHITGYKLFNFGLYDDNDAPVKLHQDMIRDFKALYNYYIDHPDNEYYTYYFMDTYKETSKNTDTKQKINTVINRILAN